ncbi:MAG: holo-ACP synthase [Clostridia bacterium]|nr:holo-ACP synthase [Clostridia bacterium]
MRVTTGVDIVEVNRIKLLINEHKDLFLQKVFTESEIEYCKCAKAHMYESFAVRFAAKEAVFKAFNVEINHNIDWKYIEILNEKTGRPIVNLKDKLAEYNKDIENIDISLSHEKEMAIASVAILWK